MISQKSPLKSDVFSIYGKFKMLDGKITPNIIDRTSGVARFDQLGNIFGTIKNSTDVQLQSMFAETFSELLRSSIRNTESIGAELSKVKLETAFAATAMGKQMQKVAKLIKMRKFLKSERQVFITKQIGFDTHNTFNLAAPFGLIDNALGSFEKEMKAQGMCDDIVILTVSDFARTTTSNGRGIDHDWGGNHFVMGRGIKRKTDA